MRLIFLMAIYALVSLLTAQGLYLLGGGEEECFRQLDVEDNPLTCLPPLIFFIEVLLGLIGAVVIVPAWAWLRGARWLPAPAQLSPILAAIVPLALAAADFSRREPQVGAMRAAWEGLELAGPALVGIAAIVLASWALSLRLKTSAQIGTR